MEGEEEKTRRSIGLVPLFVTVIKKHLTESNLRKEVWLWVTAQRNTVHSCWSPHVHSQEAKTEMNAVVPLTFSFPWPIGQCHPNSGWIFPPQLNSLKPSQTCWERYSWWCQIQPHWQRRLTTAKSWDFRLKTTKKSTNKQVTGENYLIKGSLATINIKINKHVACNMTLRR